MEGLQRRTALITGAAHTAGLGRACARRLAAFGCNVVLTDIARDFEDFPDYPGLGRPEELEEGVQELKALGVQSVAIQTDVSDEASVRAAVDLVKRQFGAIDILINNAGIRFAEPALNTSAAQWDKTYAVNVRGTFLCSREAARVMIAAGRGGRIVNIASIAALRGMKDRAAYASSKFAIIGLTQCLAIEFGPFGITVNAVCPGRVESGLSEGIYEEYARRHGLGLDEAKKKMGQYLPLGRLLRPEEVADAVAFLCAAHGSGITGQALSVSGGEEIQLAPLRE